MCGIRKEAPKLKETVWAGNRLEKMFGKKGVGEACLFSSDETARDKCREPLIKYIDARDSLSVQVHPSGIRGKNEMWIIDDVYEDSAVWVGFAENTREEVVRRCCENGTVLSLLRRYSVKKGDIFRIPGGTVHCARGISFFEVQNNMDVTYRLFDHDRGRALHLDEGLRAIAESGSAKWDLPFDVAYFDAARMSFGKTDDRTIFVTLSEKGIWGEDHVSKADCFVVPENTAIRAEGRFLKLDHF